MQKSEGFNVTYSTTRKGTHRQMLLKIFTLSAYPLISENAHSGGRESYNNPALQKAKANKSEVIKPSTILPLLLILPALHARNSIITPISVAYFANLFRNLAVSDVSTAINVPSINLIAIPAAMAEALKAIPYLKRIIPLIPPWIPKQTIDAVSMMELLCMILVTSRMTWIRLMLGKPNLLVRIRGLASG